MKMQTIMTNRFTYSFLRWILCLLMISPIGLTAQSFAQTSSTRVEAEISRRRAYIGDTLTYQITVEGGSPTGDPSVEFPPSLNATFRGGGSQAFVSTQVINGQARTVTNETFIYAYDITVLQPGMITIPPASIIVDGQPMRSNATNLESLYPREAGDDEIELTLARTSLYTNESVPLDITWWIGNSNTSEFSFDASIFPDSIKITPADPVQQSTKSFKINVAGEQVIGVYDQPTVNGIRRMRLRMRVLLTPSDPGIFELGPIRVTFNRAENNSRRFRGYCESDIVELTVNPVPEQGKPAGYAGAIGNFELTSSASNRSVNVGDPIELTLRIEGNEPMQGVRTGPDLSVDDAFNDGFRIASEGWREDLPRRSSTRVYRTTVRALDNSVTQIPPIKLPAFDPETGQYRIFESNSIPITVRAVREITLADAVGSFADTPQGTAIEQGSLESSGTGIWAHASAESMLREDGFDPWERVSSPIWITTMASGPMTALLALLAARRRSGRDRHSRAMRRAWIEARRLDSRGNHAHAVRTYLGAAIGCDPDAFSSNDLLEFSLDDDLHDETRRVLQSEEHDSFSSATDTAPAAASSDLLAKLRRAIERRAISTVPAAGRHS